MRQPVWMLLAGAVLLLGVRRRLRAVSLGQRLRLTSRGQFRTGRDRRRIGRILSLMSRMLRPEASGETMVMMRMEMDNIVVPLPREEVVVTPGRVTGLLRDRSSVLPVDLSKEPQVQTTAREEATADIVGVGVAVGGIADNLRPRLVGTKRQRPWRPITLSLWTSLPR